MEGGPITDRDFPSAPAEQDLAGLMALDTVATDHFRNRRNAPNTYSSVFGGQLVAQALAASDLTVSDRTIHSLHSYFLRSGRVEAPLDFTVERVRDGRSLSVRRVIVSQDAQPIFSMDCSYRVAMDGVRHQRAPSAAFIADDAIDPTLDQSGHPFLTEFLKRQPVNVRFAERRGFLCQGLEPKRNRPA